MGKGSKGRLCQGFAKGKENREVRRAEARELGEGRRWEVMKRRERGLALLPWYL